VLPGGDAPDNITLDQDGSLWAASHANLMALGSHIGDASVLSPVQAFQIDRDTGTPKLIYEDDGSQLSGASVIVPTQEKLLLGAIFEDGILVCDR